MAVSIQLEEETARVLQAKAKSLGMTLSAYLQSIANAGGVEPVVDFNATANSAAAFEAVLDEFFAQNPRRLPSLPADFSRADIYINHD